MGMTQSAVLLMGLLVGDSAGEQLAHLRAEVDALEGRLAEARASALTQRQALETQRADLEVLLQQEAVRVETLEEMIRGKERAQLEASTRRRAWLDPARRMAADLRAYVAGSLPFSHLARRDAVQEAVAGLDASDVDTSDVDTVARMASLWRLLEDELRLTKEVGLHEQVVVIDGQRVLAEVVHVGMAALYFYTEDGRCGWATRDGDRVVFAPFTTAPQRDAVEALFDALHRQMRRGRFVLPLPAAEVASFIGEAE